MAFTHAPSEQRAFCVAAMVRNEQAKAMGKGPIPKMVQNYKQPNNGNGYKLIILPASDNERPTAESRSTDGLQCTPWRACKELY